jgi:pyruvate/2-oxoglutarate dehydrogenase complex dihydrolipoamide dehydrogenase (E3) component
MVDRKEVRFGKIDSMSRDQLEQRLNELLEQNQVKVINGEAVRIDQPEEDLEEDDDSEESGQ